MKTPEDYCQHCSEEIEGDCITCENCEDPFCSQDCYDEHRADVANHSGEM